MGTTINHHGWSNYSRGCSIICIIFSLSEIVWQTLQVCLHWTGVWTSYCRQETDSSYICQMFAKLALLSEALKFDFVIWRQVVFHHTCHTSTHFHRFPNATGNQGFCEWENGPGENPPHTYFFHSCIRDDPSPKYIFLVENHATSITLWMKIYLNMQNRQIVFLSLGPN
jgi:hypothetical protein